MKTLLSSLALAFVLVLAAHADRLFSRSFEGTYTATLKEIPASAKALKVWIPLPASRQHQQISGVKVVDSPYRWKRRRDGLGNDYLFTTMKRPASGELSVQVKFDATRREARLSEIEAVKMSLADMKRDLQANRLVTLSPRVRALADEVTVGRSGTVAQAKAIYDHLLATMKYDKTAPGWGRGDTERACDIRKGNCTDFHSLFMSLARAKGIPVRFVIGFPLAEGESGQIKGYHCWAEFYDEATGWIPVDASDASKSQDPARRDYLFGNLDPNRIEFTTGRDLVLTPRTAEPLNFFIYPYAEANGESLGTPSITLDFKNTATGTMAAGR